MVYVHQNLGISIQYSGEWSPAALEFLKLLRNYTGQLNTHY